jgi:hypothetical protein
MRLFPTRNLTLCLLVRWWRRDGGRTSQKVFRMPPLRFLFIGFSCLFEAFSTKLCEAFFQHNGTLICVFLLLIYTQKREDDVKLEALVAQHSSLLKTSTTTPPHPLFFLISNGRVEKHEKNCETFLFFYIPSS